MHASLPRCTLGLAVALLCLAAPLQAGRPPNIVVIMADDLGYNELSCYGQDMFQTPTIDRLAEEGMRFTDFYAGNTVCGPSRASLWTGRHPGRVSVRGNLGVYERNPITLNRVGIQPGERTIGEVLQQRGYKTALCGKWHFEFFDDRGTWPSNRGFDYVIRERWNSVLNKSRADYRKEHGVVFDYNYPFELWENGERVEFEGNIEGEQRHLMDDIITDRGLEFIRENQDHPFFVFFSLKIPHSPETFSADQGEFKELGWPECERIHAVRILHLDRIVGRVVGLVDELGLAEDTMILFSSDNGGHSEGGYLEPEVDPCKHDHTFFKSNHPLRGFKRDLYEGGIRVPMIVRWKGVVEPGSSSDHVGAFWDFMATFAEMADAPVEGYEHDGLSFLPELKGEPQQAHPHLYFEYMNIAALKNAPDFGFYQALREGNLKAIRLGPANPVQVYDLDSDIGETTDVSDQHPEFVLKVEQLFTTSRTDSELFPYGGGAALDQNAEVNVISP